jgi:hypothetical protein
MRKSPRTGPAQGIEAVSFFAGGKKDTSVKPGPAAQAAGCAQNQNKNKNKNKNLYYTAS